MMMDMKDSNGEPMFNALAITLMCDACRLAGLLECPHMEHEVPHWWGFIRVYAAIRF
jgi:hypothetical protein